VDEDSVDCVEHRVTEGYSGRGMYGKDTTGITTDTPDAYFAALVRNPESWAQMLDDDEELREAAEQFRGFRMDNMGYDKILY